MPLAREPEAPAEPAASSTQPSATRNQQAPWHFYRTPLSSFRPNVGCWRERRERRVASCVENTDVVRELRQRRTPLPANVDRLSTRIRQRGLGNKQVDNAADTLAIPLARNGFGLRRARQQVRCRSHSIRRCPK